MFRDRSAAVLMCAKFQSKVNIQSLYKFAHFAKSLTKEEEINYIFDNYNQLREYRNSASY